ncbi:MAG: malto-oligosyltrehalose synthase [Anaerolineales bacterium]
MSDPSAPTASMADEIEAVLQKILVRPRLPHATYRLQFNADFTFQDAQALVGYLATLGITDLYASPLFKPRSSSSHGYDIVDYNEFNPKLGSLEDFDALHTNLAEHQMGILLDIVPNHMGIGTENTWWTDVLKQGPASEYARYFDIDWFPQNRSLDNKVLLPILGDHYGRVLENGELKLVHWDGDFYLHYYEHQFPITPESYAMVLQRALERMLEANEHEEWMEMKLSSIVWSLANLPPFTSRDDEDLAIRKREQIIERWHMLELHSESEAFRAALDAALEDFNGTPGEPDTFDALDALLAVQPYRLSYWRVATDEINYRRFFDINDMAAIRIEEREVLATTHSLTIQLLAQGKVRGLRVDHPDGLWDPELYFWRLQEMYLLGVLKEQLGIELDSHPLITEKLYALQQSDEDAWPVYVVAEKILSETEPLPESWAVYGTTGYNFMYIVNNVLVDTEQKTAFTDLYHDFIGGPVDFDELLDRSKKQIITQTLNSELEARSTQLARIVESNRRYRGFTRSSLSFAMSEFMAAFGIYRTYITLRDTVSERDREYIEEAARTASARNPLANASVFEFLRDILLMENWDEFAPESQQELYEFVMKFQQMTGPVTAKSLEDTAFYIYNRLTALNEVGGHPEYFGRTVGHFHEFIDQNTFPYAMLSTSTHDTKRSEDVRARINVLSEMPEDWQTHIQRWAEINAGAKTKIDGKPAPSPNDEYLIYQTLLGAFPDEGDSETFRQRLYGYMQKAINEAKVHSTWINTNRPYAQAIEHFIAGALDNPTFRESFDPFQQRVAYFGRFNSLTQTTLKLTVPGIPDIYQGNELWDFSLVDPDNRRPVDYDKRRALLDDLIALETDNRAGLIPRLMNDLSDGAVKLYIIYRLLNMRREHPELFLDADYIPLSIQGAKARHALGFVRRNENTALLVIVPRLVHSLMGGQQTPPLGEHAWGGTYIELPKDIKMLSFENVFTGQALSRTVGDDALVAEALVEFPVGVYLGQG